MEDIKEILKIQRDYFNNGASREISFRMEQLKKLNQVIRKHEADILDALKKDLNKSEFEGYMTEVGMVYDELRFIMKHLTDWAKPQRVRTSFTNFKSVSRIYSEPYGVVLIISPWNYPYVLSLAPLIGAIAAGNCAVVKPSNYSPNVSAVIAEVIREAFDPAYVTTIQGGRNANKNLLEERFDYIFFTGSVAVGKVVMEAASKHLTPVSLELGGKSPCIVDETANLELAAKRLVWGKYLNAGQTCVAPDYLLVHRSVKDTLLELMKKYITRFYGEDPRTNTEFPKIINEKHFNRLKGLIEGGHAVIGGRANPKTNQIEPTVLDLVEWNSTIMAEEIFGPVLPVLVYEDLKEAVSEINRHPKPLALYYFTESKERERYVLKNTSYGGGCINDTMVHLASSHMPFGGVGESGMGGYHGKASFDTFSHKKSVLKKSNRIDVPLRYPPYKNHITLLKKVMK
jgi:aldehyde dehydrogenase (NAD+)